MKYCKMYCSDLITPSLQEASPSKKHSPLSVPPSNKGSHYEVAKLD